MTTNDTVTAYYESLIQKNDDLLKELKKYNVNRISLKEIGRGGFGKVYSFKYSRSNICIKITDPFIKYKENNEENFNDYVSRYNNKINHLLAINSSNKRIFDLTNIISIYKITDTTATHNDVTRVIYVFIMEKLVPINKIKRFSFNHLFDMTIQLTRILNDLHNYTYGDRLFSLTHLDIKPSNIMCKIHDSRYITYSLVDFEDSYYTSQNRNFNRDYITASKFFGAPEIIKPETYGQDVPPPSPKSDMFSLAASIFNLYFGKKFREAYDNKTGLYNFNLDNYFPDHNNECYKFFSYLKQCLDKNPENRHSANNILSKFDIHYSASIEREIANKLIQVNNQINQSYFENHVTREDLENALETTMKDRNHAILSGKLGTGKQYLVNYYLYNHNVANYVILDCRNETTLVNTISSNEINHFVNNNNSEDSKQKSYQTFNLINEVKARILGYIELHSNIIIVFSNMNYENQYIVDKVSEIIELIKSKNVSYIITTTHSVENAIEINDFTYEQAKTKLLSNNNNPDIVDHLINQYGRNPLIISNIFNRQEVNTIVPLGDPLTIVIREVLSNLQAENQYLHTIINVSALLNDTVNTEFFFKIMKSLHNEITMEEIDTLLNRFSFIRKINDAYFIIPEIKKIIMNEMPEDNKRKILNEVYNIIKNNIDLSGSFDHIQAPFILTNKMDIFNVVGNYTYFENEEDCIKILIHLHYYVGRVLSGTEFYKNIVNKIEEYEDKIPANNYSFQVYFSMYKTNKLLFDSWTMSINEQYNELAEDLKFSEKYLPEMELIRSLYILALLNHRIEQTSDEFALKLNEKTFSIINENKYSTQNPEFYTIHYYCIESYRLLSKYHRALTGHYDIAKEYNEKAFGLLNSFYKISTVKKYIAKNKHMMYQFRYLEGILYNNRGILYMEEKSAGSNSYHAYREYIESFNRYFPYSLKDYENEIYNISLVYIRRIEELKENPRAYVYSLELGMSYLNHSYLLRKQTSLGIYLAFYYHQCFHACIALNNLFRDKEVDQILYDEEVELIDKYHSVWESDEYFKDDKIRIDTPLYMEGQKLYTIYDILIDWFNVDKETLKQWSKQTFQEKLLFKCIAFLDEVKSHSITEQVIYDENQVLIETEIPKISSKRQLSLGYCDSGITYRKIVQYYKANKKDYSEFLIKGEVDFKRAISISNTLSINTTLKKAYKEFPALYECSDNIQKAIDICQQGIDANIDEKLTTTLKEKKGKLK